MSLTGNALENFLNDLDTSLKEQEEAGVDDEISKPALLQALENQPLKADTMATLSQLVRLWRTAGKPAAAKVILEADAPDILATLSAEEKVAAQLHLAFWRYDVLNDLQDPAAKTALQDLFAEAEKQSEPDRDHWVSISNRARAAGEFALVRRAISAIHSIMTKDEGRTRYRAWDEAKMHAEFARSFWNEGDKAKAQELAQLAVATLQNAAPEQDVDEGDWLRLADGLGLLIPDQLETMIAHAKAKLGEASISAQREFEIQAGRTRAEVAYEQGDLVKATTLGLSAHYGIRRDEGDEFTVKLLQWMMESDQKCEAAKLAFESAYMSRQSSSGLACQMAHYELAQEGVAIPAETKAWWILTLMSATAEESLHWVCQDEDPAHFYARHQKMLLPLLAGNAALQAANDALEGIRLAEAGEYAAALPLLEATALTKWSMTQTIKQLWLSRLCVLGVEKAFALPFPEPHNANSCYNLGFIGGEWGGDDDDDDDDDEESFTPPPLPNDEAWPYKKMQELGQRYYELGAQKFEAFFASGQGAYGDAEAHTYSMLCNNLSIIYKNQDNYSAAAELHHKGIAASSFAEHYHGLLNCQKKLSDKASYIKAAEELWYYASENGYSRHDPANYIDDVVDYLDDLNRDEEIPIWLERLDSWWNELDEEDQEEHKDDYFYCLGHTLHLMKNTRPEDALLRLQRSEKEILARGYPVATMQIGFFYFKEPSQPERALEIFQQTLTQHSDFKRGETQAHEFARNKIAELTQGNQAGKKKPFWKIW
jgi:hypothetical protein